MIEIVGVGAKKTSDTDDSFRMQSELACSLESRPRVGDEPSQLPDRSMIQLRATFRLGQCNRVCPSKQRPRRLSSESRGLAIEGHSTNSPNSSQ